MPKRLYGKTPNFKDDIRPSLNDALELTFTVINDLINNNNKINGLEQNYVFAKRALTLLNSVLIFYGVSLETYEKRIKFANTCSVEDRFPLNKNELRVFLYTLSSNFLVLLRI